MTSNSFTVLQVHETPNSNAQIYYFNQNEVIYLNSENILPPNGS
jgi:hypothetical protein